MYTEPFRLLTLCNKCTNACQTIYSFLEVEEKKKAHSII